MKKLEHHDILALHSGCISAGLVSARSGLMAGIAAAFVASLPEIGSPAQQLLSDLNSLNAVGLLVDGTSPFKIWLLNAVALSASRQESAIFTRILDRYGGNTGYTKAAADRPRAGEQINDNLIDFVIITAIEVERIAVCSAFGLRDEHRVPKESRVYWRGKIELSNDRYYEIAVAQSPDMANVDAALVANDALHHWKPGAALLVGIAAAAHEDVRLGDVVVASDVYYYERGKETATGRKPEPKMQPADSTLWSRVIAMAAWDGNVPAKRPDRGAARMHKGVIASGEKVIADAAVREEIASKHRKILAIEMEGYGFSRAVWQSFDRVRHLVVRGICDDASSAKDDRWHPYAAAAAAGFTRHFLLDRPLEPRSGTDLAKCSSPPPQLSVTSTFTENNWVALGDSVIAEGERVAVDREKWTIILNRFIIGNVSELARLGGQFDSVPEHHRYVVLNATGEGRALAAPLVWRKEGARFLVTATLAPVAPIVDVWTLHDLDFDKFSEVRGIEAALSILRYRLMMQQGHVNSEGLGRIRQLCERLGNANRLDDLIKLEIVRLASVPTGSDGPAPLGFVEHVAGVTVRAHEGDNHRIGLELDFVGAGRWKGDVWLNLPLGDFYHDGATDSADGIPPDLAAWLKALDEAYGTRPDAQKHKAAALAMWMGKLQSADRSIAAQRRRAVAFANQAVHVDLRSDEAMSQKLGSLMLINDYESANLAATSIKNKWALIAFTMGSNSPKAVAAEAASNAAAAARDVRPADAATASVAVASAIYGEHKYRFTARWTRLDKYVQAVLHRIFDEE